MYTYVKFEFTLFDFLNTKYESTFALQFIIVSSLISSFFMPQFHTFWCAQSAKNMSRCMWTTIMNAASSDGNKCHLNGESIYTKREYWASLADWLHVLCVIHFHTCTSIYLRACTQKCAHNCEERKWRFNQKQLRVASGWNNFHASLSPPSSSDGYSSTSISPSDSSPSKCCGLPLDLLPDFESLSSCCMRLCFVLTRKKCRILIKFVTNCLTFLVLTFYFGTTP